MGDVALGSSIERRVPGNVCIDSFLNGNCSEGVWQGVYLPALYCLRRTDSAIVISTGRRHESSSGPEFALIIWPTGCRIPCLTARRTGPFYDVTIPSQYRIRALAFDLFLENTALNGRDKIHPLALDSPNTISISLSTKACSVRLARRTFSLTRQHQGSDICETNESAMR